MAKIAAQMMLAKDDGTDRELVFAVAHVAEILTALRLTITPLTTVKNRWSRRDAPAPIDEEAQSAADRCSRQTKAINHSPRTGPPVDLAGGRTPAIVNRYALVLNLAGLVTHPVTALEIARRFTPAGFQVPMLLNGPTWGLRRD